MKKIAKRLDIFSSKETDAVTIEMMNPRFERAGRIPDTLQFHAFIPDNNGRLQLTILSVSTDNDFLLTQKRKKIK